MGFHFAVRALAVLVTVVVTTAALNGCGKKRECLSIVFCFILAYNQICGGLFEFAHDVAW